MAMGEVLSLAFLGHKMDYYVNYCHVTVFGVLCCWGKSWLPFFAGFPWVFHQKTQNDICHGFWFLQLHFSAIQLQISEHTKYEPQLGAFSVHFSVGVCVGGCFSAFSTILVFVCSKFKLFPLTRAKRKCAKLHERNSKLNSSE